MGELEYEGGQITIRFSDQEYSLDLGDMAGGAAWFAGGKVGAAPFFLASEYTTGKASIGFLLAGSALSGTFSIGGVTTALGEFKIENVPGTFVGAVVGTVLSPVLGLVAGQVTNQTLGRLIGAIGELMDLEDPDGGFNGAGLQRLSYGSAIVLIDSNGNGIPDAFTNLGAFATGSIRAGDEWNALDQIAAEQYLELLTLYSDEDDNDIVSAFEEMATIGAYNEHVTGYEIANNDDDDDDNDVPVYHTSNPGQWTDDGWDSDGDGDVDSNDDDWEAGDSPPIRPTGLGQPVIVDLDGDGIEVNAASQVNFDWDNDGYLESGNWAAADDGFLVVDLEADGTIGANGGDGVIDQGREIAFSQWAPDEEFTDLQALAEATDADGNLIFDSNGDGVLDANDDLWTSMKIFQDLDQNGEVDDGELKTLDEWGITQINLAYDDGSSFSEFEDDIVALGNILHGMASYVRDGEVVEGGVGDVSLLYNTQGWRYVETDSGYQIEFEDGDETMVFWDAEGQASADVDLNIDNLAGAYGDARDNVLDATGVEQDLVITGGEGNDQILGGDANDMLSGGQGADTIHAAAGHDVVLADSEDDITGGAITGGDGYDKLIVSEETTLNISDLGAIGFEAVIAGDGDDVVTALDDEQGYNIAGNAGADTLTTAGGADVLSGGDDDDVLTSGAGSDRLFGGDGDDLLDGGDDADFLAGGAGDDTLLGGEGNDVYYIQRGGGHDTIHDIAIGTVFERIEYEENIQYGSGKNARYVNELRTGYTETIGQIDGGIDTLDFAYGISLDDVLFQMVGDDAVIELRALDDPETDDVVEQGVDAEQSVTVQDWSDIKSRIENFSFSSGLILDVSEITDGQTGFDEGDVLVGTNAGDWINSGGGNDLLIGNGGRDILIAGDGNDSLYGGQGRDFLFGGNSDDNLLAESGNDYVLAGGGDDYVDGGDGNDVLSGDAGNDTIIGGAGNDTLLGGIGDDTLFGGAGDDLYLFFRGDGHDHIHDLSEELQTTEEATGNTVYERSGKRGKWVQEMRSVDQMVQVDGGWDVLQFGYSVTIEDLFFELQGTDLAIGIRELNSDGSETLLGDLDDTVTIEDWTNSDSRIEELRFGDGFAIDISDFEGFQSGYEQDDILTGTAGNDLLHGGLGGDSLLGDAGNDVLVGGYGHDFLEGGDGDDNLIAGDGDDSLIGGVGADYLIGGQGSDTLQGGAGDDVLIGGTGDDTLMGGLGDDTYLFSRGDGHDLIDESVFSVTDGGVTTTENGTDDFSAETQTFHTGGKSGYNYDANVWVSETRTGATVSVVEGGNDTLQFGSWISLSDLNVNSANGELFEDLVIELAPVGTDGEVIDSITIDGWVSPEFRIETFRFTDGVVLDTSSIIYAKTGTDGDDIMSVPDGLLDGELISQLGDGFWLVGGGGNDTLISGAGSLQSGADILTGGIGNDTLHGGYGNDVYYFEKGDGQDVIFDESGIYDRNNLDELPGDSILFGAGITIDDLVLQMDGTSLVIYVNSGSDEKIVLSNWSDTITVENWFPTSGTNNIELLQFTNNLDFFIGEIEATYLGADLTGEAVVDPVDDVLTGMATDDWIDGFAGDDTISGNGGADFIFGGDGNDIIDAGNGDDIVSAGDGNDVVSGGIGNDVMTGGDGDDSLSGDAGDDVLMGGSGDDVISGGAGTDLIVGDVGNDTIVGSAGQDQVRFGYGDGQDVYQAVANQWAATTGDVLIFEDGISFTNVWFERIGNDLKVSLIGTDDQITFEDWFYGTDMKHAISGFFANGEFIDAETASKTAEVAAYIDLLTDDPLPHYLVIGDTISFSSLNLIDLEISREERTDGWGNVLRIHWDDGVTSGTFDIAESAANLGGIEFADGSTYTFSTTGSAANDLIVGEVDTPVLDGMAGDDLLYGGANADTLYGGEGNDVLNAGGNLEGGYQVLSGGEGSDSYIIAADQGDLYIDHVGEAFAYEGIDSLVFSDLTLSDLSIGTLDYVVGEFGSSLDGTALIMSWNTENGIGSITLADMGSNIEEFIFADGTVLSSIEVDFATYGRDRYKGTAGDDFIATPDTDWAYTFGLDGDDVLQGGSGRDYLFGGNGDDILSSGGNVRDSGSDVLYGGAGSDTYLISASDSYVLVTHTSEGVSGTDVDRIEFTDLAMSDLTFSIHDYTQGGTVEHVYGEALSVNWDGGKLIVANGAENIEEFVFADGTVLSSISVDHYGTADRLVGTSGDDVIVGTASRDYIFGGAGDDILDAGGTDGGTQALYGRDGSDTYLHSKANGNLIINTSGESASHIGTDRFEFVDLDFADVSISIANEFLFIDWADGSYAGNVKLSDGGAHIEEFVFADGTVLSEITVGGVSNGADLLKATDGDDFVATGDTGWNYTYGLNGDDTLSGGEGRDYLFGGAGDDVLSSGGYATGNAEKLYGGSGDDTYLIHSGDDFVFINHAAEVFEEGSNDQIVFTDLNVSDVALSLHDYTQGGTVVHADGVSLDLDWDGGTLRVANSGDEIESVVFADGSEFTIEELWAL